MKIFTLIITPSVLVLRVVIERAFYTLHSRSLLCAILLGMRKGNKGRGDISEVLPSEKMRPSIFAQCLRFRLSSLSFYGSERRTHYKEARTMDFSMTAGYPWIRVLAVPPFVSFFLFPLRRFWGLTLALPLIPVIFSSLLRRTQLRKLDTREGRKPQC